jgi:hypothetical protein
MEGTSMPATVAASFVTSRFSLRQASGWEDKTLYTLVGPVDNGIQHNLTIVVDDESKCDTLRDYAEAQVERVVQELKGCRILKKDMISLANGLPAFRAIFSWYPTDNQRVYQEQIFVVHDGAAYRLTATFTKKTRRTLGPIVEKMMLSFTPRTANTVERP